MPAESSNAVRPERTRGQRPRGIVVTNLYRTPEEPARGTFNQQQFSHLQQLHDVLVVVPQPRRYPCAPGARFEVRTQSAAPETVYLDVWHPPMAGRLINAALLEAAVSRSLHPVLSAWEPDYVLGSFAYPDGVAAVGIARRLGVPAFIKVHGSDINVMLRDPAVRWQVRRALRKASGVIAVSRALVQKVTALGVRADDTLLLYNGIDKQRFQPCNKVALRTKLHLAQGRKSVLYVGNLKGDKGVFDLLEAFNFLAGSHPELDLEYVGSGPAQEQLRSDVGNRGLSDRVRLHGAWPHADVADWIGASELLCLPSHAEGLPNVVLEAQACGRPVVATEVGGIPEVLNASGGLLVPAQQPQMLAAALRETLQRNWNAAAIAESLPIQGWKQNVTQLSEFILTRCARTGELAVPTGEG